MWSVLLLVASIALIVVLTTQLRLHPFAALLLAAFFYGTLAGMPPIDIVTAINDGFGQTIGSIGIVIVIVVFISIVALSAGIWFAYRYASRIELNNSDYAKKVEEDRGLEQPPSSFDAALPIAIPILLIVGRTFAELPTQPFGAGTTAELLSFLGQPSIALSIGVIAAASLVPSWLDDNNDVRLESPRSGKGRELFGYLSAVNGPQGAKLEIRGNEIVVQGIGEQAGKNMMENKSL